MPPSLANGGALANHRGAIRNTRSAGWRLECGFAMASRRRRRDASDAFEGVAASRPDALDAELRLQEVVDRLRVGLAAGGFHYLADEPAECLRLRLGLGDLVGIGGDDLVHHLLDRRQIRNLLHAACLDEFERVPALPPDDLEQVFGDLA